MKTLERRKFLASLATASAVTGMGNFSPASAQATQADVNTSNRFKISLNAYSFNTPLRNGSTTLDAVLDFCAVQGFDAVDLTGYYFPGYPEVPSDAYIYQLKRKAHKLGLAISGTGIRNEFAIADARKRAEEVLFVKKWIDVAAKLGAPVIRIFTARDLPENNRREEVTGWIVSCIKDCVAYGKQQGVIVAVQNHHDFIRTADQMIEVINGVNSEWFGLVLDTGSFVTLDPYDEIRKTAGYAVNWQVKEKLSYNGKTELMDLGRLMRIIKASTYRGYLPIETLSPGDPFTIVPAFLADVKHALQQAMTT